jgi:hypothetical protein
MKAFILIWSSRHSPTRSTATAQQPATERRTVSLDSGLGNVDHPVSTKNAEAQKVFQSGARVSLRVQPRRGSRVVQTRGGARSDARDGVTGDVARTRRKLQRSGEPDRFAEAYVHLQKAIELAPNAGEADRAYINALSKRYSKDPNADKAKLASEYARRWLSW